MKRLRNKMHCHEQFFLLGPVNVNSHFSFTGESNMLIGTITITYNFNHFFNQMNRKVTKGME